MKALSGVERAWAGAKATQHEPPPLSRAARHLALGGRTGEVVPREARTPAEETDGITAHDRAATETPVTRDGIRLLHGIDPT